MQEYYKLQAFRQTYYVGTYT